jgi:hypothetical protein
VGIKLDDGAEVLPQSRFPHVAVHRPVRRRISISASWRGSIGWLVSTT